MIGTSHEYQQEVTEVTNPGTMLGFEVNPIYMFFGGLCSLFFPNSLGKVCDL
jgi:hypothetical protein